MNTLNSLSKKSGAKHENVLWSAETIHGHLVLLGFDPPCPDTIRKYIVKPTGGTAKGQTWLNFLRNHLEVSWAIDFFTKDKSDCVFWRPARLRDNL